MTAARIATALAATAVLAAASYQSMRFARADACAREEVAEQARKAAAIVPESAAYQLRLAGLLDAAGDSAGAQQAWLEALRLNPRESKAWIGLGLQFEIDGRTAEAEKHLLQAARTDRQCAPAWSLAGFYLRRSRWPEFWRWANYAAGMCPGDGLPVFRLMWRTGANAAEIFRKGVPEETGAVRRYLAFLTAEGRAEALPAPALWLAGKADSRDALLLLLVCDQLLVRGDQTGALALWSELSARRMIPQPPLNPAAGLVLTNGDFAADPLSRGFDWRLHPVEGSSVSLAAGSPRSLRIVLTGSQPESCELISQILPVVPGARYSCRFRYRTEEIASPGLRWRVVDPHDGRDLTESSPELLSAGETEAEIRFRVTDTATLVRLFLAYRRVPGTVRSEGSLWLSEFRAAQVCNREGPGASK